MRWSTVLRYAESTLGHMVSGQWTWERLRFVAGSSTVMLGARLGAVHVLQHLTEESDGRFLWHKNLVRHV